jgi:hypothetical protein
MSNSISTLLTRNLNDVFGENDPRATGLSKCRCQARFSSVAEAANNSGAATPPYIRS